MLRLPQVGRLGLEHLLEDHLNSLVDVDQDNTVHTSKTDVLVFFAAPTAVGVAVALADANIRAISQMLAGVAIITGLLFGLLTHVLGLGTQVAADERFTSSSRIAILVDELRANVSYAIGVGIVLTTGLMLVGAFSGDITDPKESGYPGWASGLMIGGLLHLMLTLFMVLNRIRATYKLLAK